MLIFKILYKESVCVEFELRENSLDSGLDELEEVWHLSELLIRIYIVCSVLELISVVLDSAIEHLVPLFRVKSRNQLLGFILRDEIIKDVESWNGTCASNLSFWEINNFALFQILLLQSRVEKDQHTLLFAN